MKKNLIVISDTAVMPKQWLFLAIRIYLECSRQYLVKVADQFGLKLRQNYNRELPSLVSQVDCYVYTKQLKWMN